jgi:hypothetical protein
MLQTQLIHYHVGLHQSLNYLRRLVVLVKWSNYWNHITMLIRNRLYKHIDQCGDLLPDIMGKINDLCPTADIDLNKSQNDDIK